MISRTNLKSITKYSNISTTDLEENLVKHVYPQLTDWKKLTRLFIVSLGIAFLSLGIIFFFAYNWHALHKFTKLGIMLILICLSTLTSINKKLKTSTQGIILTGASMLIGAFFATFGQIYQTGANAYDFFLGWTAFITLWVVIANFPPLWLIYILLINTTFILYGEQVQKDWDSHFIQGILFSINVFVTTVFFVLSKKPINVVIPKWFINCLILLSISIGTIACISAIWEYSSTPYYIFLLVIPVYAIGYWYGLKNKNITLASSIPFSSIIICCCALAKKPNMGLLLIDFLFAVVATTLLVRHVIHLQKSWKNG